MTSVDSNATTVSALRAHVAARIWSSSEPMVTSSIDQIRRELVA